MRNRERVLRFGVWLMLAGLCFHLLAEESHPVPVRAAATAAIKVMPLGDSITSGTDQWASYRCELHKSLIASGYNIDFVGSVHGQWGVPNQNMTPPSYCNMIDPDEEGHSGWAIYHILSGVPNNWPGNLQSWVTTNVPDVVLIHLGTNNFVYTTPAPDVDAAVSQMGQVIDTLRMANPRVRILLAQILPCKCDTLNMIPAFNDRLPALAASKQRLDSPIIVVDMYTGFNFTDHFNPDGVHPNLNGENKMAVRWKAGFDRFMLINKWVFIPLTVK